MMIEKSGSIRLRDIPVAGNLPPEQQAFPPALRRSSGSWLRAWYG